MPRRPASLSFLASALLLLAASGPGCMSAYKKSVGGTGEEVYTKIYLTDFNTAWQAVLDSLKSARLDVSNRESGFVQTKWTDNTEDRNFVDSTGLGQAYLKAQYRFKVSVAKGFYSGEPSVKITIQKDQLVKQDVLEGWKRNSTDGIDENTLLYRIGRIIHIRMKMARMEEERIRRELEESGFQ